MPVDVQSQAVSVSGHRADGQPADRQLHVCPAQPRPAGTLPRRTPETASAELVHRFVAQLTVSVSR